MALSNFHIKNGNIFENGKAVEMKILNGTEIKIQAKGSGTYKVIGTLWDGTPKTLPLVDMSTFDIVDSAENDTVYCTDVASLTTVTVEEVSASIESIYIDIYVR